MIALHHNDMSTCSQKVRIALAEKGITGWTSHHLALRKGDQHRPDYLRLNPNGVVPTLVHDGVPVIESTVINEYIEDAFDGPKLMPDDGYGRARVRMWTRQLDQGVHAATGVLSSCIAFRYQHFDGKTEQEVLAHIENIPDAAKRERQRENILKGMDSRHFVAAVGRFAKLLSDMDAALQDFDWLAGEGYSLADAAFTPYMVRLEDLQQSWLWDDRPKLAGWFDRLRARASFDPAVTDWRNDAYLPLMADKGAEALPRVKAIVAER